MIIEPEGLFGGERLAACSDLAQLYWPRLYIGSNGYARLELSYPSIISKIFRNFRKVPDQKTLWNVFREYEANYLAVLYEADGTWWCQFATSEKFLPRYKTRRDSESPSPSAETMQAFRKGYMKWKSTKSLSGQPFQKIPEDFGKFPLERRGVGVGVGEGVGVVEEPPEVAKNATSSSGGSPDQDGADFFELEVAQTTKTRKKARPERVLAVEDVWKFYQETFNKQGMTLTDKRKQKGLARLGEALRMPEANGNLAVAVNLMKAAIEEVAQDPWEGRLTFNDWEKYVFGSAERFENWVDRWRKGSEKEERSTERRQAYAR